MTDYGRREADRDNASRLRVLRQRRLRLKEAAIAVVEAARWWRQNHSDDNRRALDDALADYDNLKENA